MILVSNNLPSDCFSEGRLVYFETEILFLLILGKTKDLSEDSFDTYI